MGRVNTLRKHKERRGNTCCICKLNIPVGIVNKQHPLYATIEHVIPKSKGGGKGQNLKLSHNLCNTVKGNSIQLSQEIVKYLQVEIQQNLDRLNSNRNIFICYKPEQIERTKLRRLLASRKQLDRWENEGGSYQ